ncbi:ParA family protein [Aeromonas veronii]
MIIAFACSKGGVGKTTATVQLAGEVKPDLIIDQDVHQGITWINNRRPADSRWNVLSGLNKTALIKELKTADDKVVLIDCGGFDSELTRIAIAAADMTICPLNDDITEQIGMVRFNNILAEISKDAGVHIAAHVIMTRTNPSRKNFTAIREAVESLSNLTMMDSRLSKRADFPTQMELGLGITERAATRNSEAGKEVTAFAEEVKEILAKHTY